MKKRINTDAIVNELEGSVFFPARPVEQNMPLEPRQQPEPQSSTPVRDVPPVRPVPPEPLEREVLPVPRMKRVMKQRHPFDIYHDQYETLKHLADEDRRQGGLGSMSAMVREAIDVYLQTKKKPQK